MQITHITYKHTYTNSHSSTHSTFLFEASPNNAAAANLGDYTRGNTTDNPSTSTPLSSHWNHNTNLTTNNSIQSSINQSSYHSSNISIAIKLCEDVISDMKELISNKEEETNSTGNDLGSILTNLQALRKCLGSHNCKLHNVQQDAIFHNLLQHNYNNPNNNNSSANTNNNGANDKHPAPFQRVGTHSELERMTGISPKASASDMSAHVAGNTNTNTNVSGANSSNENQPSSTYSIAATTIRSTHQRYGSNLSAIHDENGNINVNFEGAMNNNVDDADALRGATMLNRASMSAKSIRHTKTMIESNFRRTSERAQKALKLEIDTQVMPFALFVCLFGFSFG